MIEFPPWLRPALLVLLAWHKVWLYTQVGIQLKGLVALAFPVERVPLSFLVWLWCMCVFMWVCTRMPEARVACPPQSLPTSCIFQIASHYMVLTGPELCV